MNCPVTFLTAAAGFAADRALKIAASKSKGERSFLKNKITIKKTTNKGFAMNKCEGKRGLVVAVSIVAVLAVVFLLWLTVRDDENKSKRPAAAMLLAGAIGNTYDRIRHGFVIDYISVAPIKKIIFNLADVFIALGALLYLLL
ncbi:MAG: signal peptidase II [Lachnospiraceae bacterium]|nr:signal peptidase II [Lachnospiraceae bacterium]